MKKKQEQHTQGRLTFEEQFLPEDNGVSNGVFILQNGVPICNLFNDSKETARRLVACWNACEGISTEEIEGAGGIGNGGIDEAKY